VGAARNLSEIAEFFFCPVRNRAWRLASAKAFQKRLKDFSGFWRYTGVVLMEEKTSTDSLRTRVSLLDRVKNLDDARSWEEFFHVYDRLVQGLARQRGLGHHEAEEVAQEVFKRVAQTIHEFERAPRPGSFRKWLFQLTRWRADDKKRRERVPHALSLEASDEDGTPLLEQLPAPPDPLFDLEVQTRLHLLETLFRQISPTVPPRHLQIFQLLVIDGMPVERVAQLFHMNNAAIYVIKHRITAKLREEVRRLPLDW
jgi:RNA polymerase sigma-70 factor (ECF subfamily)